MTGKSYATPVRLGDVMGGEAVTRVVASNRSDYAEGDIVLAPTEWRTHALSDGSGPYDGRLRKLDPAAAPVTTGLGVLGMPGFTAYSGMRVIGQPQPGETVVVAAASGPVCGLIDQYNGANASDGTDRLPATMRESTSKSLSLRGFINYDFAAQYYADFLQDVGAGTADGSIRYREDIVDGLENAPEAFVGMLDGRNFGKPTRRGG
jgi:NADPH-dependent curcumin reductase CurA